MMSDDKLLELAAKAAGYNVRHLCGALGYFLSIDGVSRWNSLADDGDALRLAADLKFCVDIRSIVVSVEQIGPNTIVFVESCSNDTEARLKAARRAITRAAAELGNQSDA
jgi:hypothetical protein